VIPVGPDRSSAPEGLAGGGPECVVGPESGPSALGNAR